MRNFSLVCWTGLVSGCMLNPRKWNSEFSLIFSHHFMEQRRKHHIATQLNYWQDLTGNGNYCLFRPKSLLFSSLCREASIFFTIHDSIFKVLNFPGDQYSHLAPITWIKGKRQHRWLRLAIDPFSSQPVTPDFCLDSMYAVELQVRALCVKCTVGLRIILIFIMHYLIISPINQTARTTNDFSDSTLIFENTNRC